MQNSLVSSLWNSHLAQRKLSYIKSFDLRQQNIPFRTNSTWNYCAVCFFAIPLHRQKETDYIIIKLKQSGR